MNTSSDRVPDFQSAEQFMLQKLRRDLSADLSYHGYHHTMDVMQAAMAIATAEQLTAEEQSLLSVAVAFHDAGFVHSYGNHEQQSCMMAREYLPDFGFETSQIDSICDMIMATKIPQKPVTKSEQIICDADLDYLGREDVLPVADSLYKELNKHVEPLTERSWDELQIAFLKAHHYHTNYSRNLREQKKQDYLQFLIAKWGSR